jgi:excisionase family DNA binding protein
MPAREATIRLKMGIKKWSMPEADKRLWDSKRLAEYLNLNLGTIRNWAWMKRIPYYKVGGRLRFKKSEIDEWLERQKQEPQDRRW